MRRVGNLWHEVVGFDNLCRAARNAARAKHATHCVARFLERLEPQVLLLQRELETGRYRPGVPFEFEILDPKPRVISAAPFRDRVVHHALIDVCEPHFDRRMIAESFACRRGKGTHKALAHAQRMVRRFAWFLKLDVKSFFPSLEPAVVLETLARVIKDRRVLALCATILGNDPGLPIGALTSQWFANLVLDRLDHHVKEVLRVESYVRYMDDMVLFADQKARLQGALPLVEGFLHEHLHLRLKERATQLAPVRVGLPFLGFHVFRGTMRVRPENLRRSKARIRARQRQHQRHEIDESQLADAVRSVIAHLEHGTTRALRRRWFANIE